MTDRIHADVDALVADAASWFLGRLAAAQAAGRVPHVVLTGGSIAAPFHREVARAAAGSGVDLTRVEWWWGDERFVPADSPERNCRSGLDDLLHVVGAPAERVHVAAASDAVETVEESARRYQQQLRASGVREFEVALFGLGPDGHVASLFPHHPAAAIRDALVVPVHDSPKPPPQRVSLTYEAFAATRAVAFLAAGEGKAEAVAAAHGEGTWEECPARGVRGQDETVWFLDAAAASALQ
ncbi:6-phosphogluconolactonase [Nocardioides daphniae]|uniref:6-phosphogluconolactonase n=1 Tax=Nocardioides daphniae TaxID=402297 RepID=A0A4P7UBB2_9ACTN|nr:6-phosphogluconolactonase [Nocardioides daphniae]QCC77256.1 6-phosphogluconolactonase [Nocardioides daphniae]GGD26150.1 hypothetical protein GCM10007231_26930 [Nocardioides daphniae]